jgi:hypothetical protein
VLRLADQAIVQTGEHRAHRPAPCWPMTWPPARPLLAYDLATGRLAWRADMPTFVQTPPVPAAGGVLIQPADPGYACLAAGSPPGQFCSRHAAATARVAGASQGTCGVQRWWWPRPW